MQINLNTENKYLSESFVWDGEQISKNKIKEFMNYLIQDLLADHLEEEMGLNLAAPLKDRNK